VHYDKGKDIPGFKIACDGGQWEANAEDFTSEVGQALGKDHASLEYGCSSSAVAESEEH